MPRSAATCEAGPTACLFFARAPPDVTSEEISATFSQYGPVEGVNIYRSWYAPLVVEWCDSRKQRSPPPVKGTALSKDSAAAADQEPACTPLGGSDTSDTSPTRNAAVPEGSGRNKAPTKGSSQPGASSHELLNASLKVGLSASNRGTSTSIPIGDM
ncbi:hypothetical protein OEZ85_003811 [Tetradesmus obliquus]|uniref:RRM domain-containing protein n=1 Tax=Tetradesmus obliquus TaxID=3088 RepID=A0ABY8UCS5_TETOB|nr:hypothetical protein OEZ85_003811 [Tetradesmus obliquus]